MRSGVHMYECWGEAPCRLIPVDTKTNYVEKDIKILTECFCSCELFYQLQTTEHLSDCQIFSWSDKTSMIKYD